MDENKLGFLFKAASLLTRSKNQTYDILRSHYLMRCPEFSTLNETPNSSLTKVRCSHCCLEWKTNTTSKVTPIKLSKRQKKRIKSKHTDTQNILHCKQLERICSFCVHVTSIYVPKLFKKENNIGIEKNATKTKSNKKQQNLPIQKKQELSKQKTLNVYSNISEIYSLKNESNMLKPAIISVKINNNKKKKDKFAGLCQKAVLDAAKRKTDIEKKNKLNLFLKASE